MECCPTCEATFRGDRVCSRCGTDLGEILEVERAAVRFQQEAFAALRAGRREAAYGHATRACEFHCSPDSVKALAVTALACGKFDEAVALWREYRRCVQTDAGDEQ